ncbi:4'-phosphopantetheinyl transferase sfp [Pandoraea capi]|uniref:4'-phosphopantetheinyl transferase sfp n=1 Tax=Pandoraea capi TaxID=2508286 RepID=A0ABY6W1U9_9BURK|nr:4'-phosphopantetheinyl transferase superfamily protein [Pandoraea capi]VVE16030.1 4'-phosphopantetheinyl transferase sfp [Pandoraea capi]
MTARARQLHGAGRWPADLDVWHVPLGGAPAAQGGEAADATPDIYRYLDADELARARRFRYDVDRERFAKTRSALRVLLSKYTGIPPESIGFTQGEFGRPELAPVGAEPGASLSFNVSHTGGDALIAISRTRSVGIDLEVQQRALNWQELAPLVCTAQERADIDSLPSPARCDAFLRCWTAKEAILKTIGLGIAEGLLCLRVDVGHLAVQRPIVADVADASRFQAAGQLNFLWIDDVPGCQACLAWQALSV